jgi:hypothetical protein
LKLPKRYLTGVTLFLTVRDLSKAKRVVGEALVNLPRVHLLNSFNSIRACAAKVYDQSDEILNIFIANARSISCTRKTNKTVSKHDLERVI